MPEPMSPERLAEIEGRFQRKAYDRQDVRELVAEVRRLRDELETVQSQAIVTVAQAVDAAAAERDRERARRDAVAGRFTDLVEGLGELALVELLNASQVRDAEAVAVLLRDALDVERFEGRIVEELSGEHRDALGYTVETVVGDNSATYRVFYGPDGHEVSPDTYLPPGVVAQATWPATAGEPR